MKHFAPASLEVYNVFNADVIDETECQADYIRQFDTHHELIAHLDAPSDNDRIQYDGYNPIEVFHIPAVSGDRRGAVVVGLAMANPLDGGQRFQAAALSLMAQDYDVIAFGNPSGGDFNSGVLSKQQRKEVVKGNARPIIDPMMKYIDEQGYDSVIPYGFSYGAEIAAELAGHIDNEVPGFITVESASAKKEVSPVKGIKFTTTNGPFKGYVLDSNMDAFVAAREDSLSPGEFNKGILTLSSLAIGRYIARGDHDEKIARALMEQPDAVHTGFWAEKSEFGNGKLMPGIYQDLSERFPGQVVGHAIKGQRHAFANHIPTQMAMFAQGMKHAA